MDRVQRPFPLATTPLSMQNLFARAQSSCAPALLALLALVSAAEAHVTLDAPNGGETLNAGQVVTVQWHVQIAHGQLNWDLWYSTSGPAGPWIPIAMDLAPGSTTVNSMHQYDWTVPNAPSSQVRVRVRMDNAGTDYLDISNANLTIQAGCPQPVNYCSTSPNSLGAGALMGFGGTASVASNNLSLSVSAASAIQPGLFFYGPGQIQAPFGDGFRCVGAGGLGVFRLGPPVVSDAAGNGQRVLDLNAAPANSGPGLIQAGDTWNFQFWYRDPAAGGSGFNLSDGLSVTFCG
jgi:hypothetical protein